MNFNKINKYAYYISIVIISFMGIYFRTLGYLANRSLSGDEASLVRNILHFNSSLHLLSNQCAPSLFLVGTKLLTIFLGLEEQILRFIPFLSSIISIFVFYVLSTKILQKRYSIVFALFLFSFNFYLLRYSSEFKQYSSDVLLFISAILYFSSFDFNERSIRKIFQDILVSLLFVASSFPTTFVIAGKLLQSLTNISKKSILPFAIYSSITILLSYFYYLVFLLPSRMDMIATWGGFWQRGFLTLNMNKILFIVKENLEYFFIFNDYLIILTTILLGAILLLTRKRNNYVNLIFYSFIFVIFASILHIYPLFKRAALYISPILIILISKPLDLLSIRNKIYSGITVLLSIIIISKFNVNYFRIISQKYQYERTPAQEFLSILKKQIDTNDTILVCNGSCAMYEYYSIGQQIHNKILIEPKTLPDVSDLKPGYYWFYFPNCVHQNNLALYLKKGEILFINKKYNGVLAHIKIK